MTRKGRITFAPQSTSAIHISPRAIGTTTKEKRKTEIDWSKFIFFSSKLNKYKFVLLKNSVKDIRQLWMNH